MVQISMGLTRMARGRLTHARIFKKIFNHYLIRYKEFKPVGTATKTQKA
jgi:hypothetical protein